MSVLPKCPRCGDNRLVFEDDDRGLWCNYCKIAFDNNPNEGGDYSNDPTKRIERQETWEAARTAVKGRRGRRSDRGSHRRHSRRG